MADEEKKTEKDVWHPDHKRQTINLREIGGWGLMAVALWRFSNWPATGPSKYDALSTLVIFAFGGAGALPRTATLFASWVVELWPWGANRKKEDEG